MTEKHFRPLDPIRERILIFGDSSSGKSSCALSISNQMKITKSPGKFYVIDTDGGSYERMLFCSTSRFKLSRKMVEVIEVHEWPEYVAALNHIAKKVKPGDWVVVDMMCDAWEACKNYCTKLIYGSGKSDFLSKYRIRLDKKRKISKSGDAPAHEQKDWEVVNAHYDEWFSRLQKRLRCHVMCCTGTTKLRTEYLPHSKETQRAFGPLGIVPSGQKSLMHKFHTVILTTGKVHRQEWFLTTVKDREREPLTDHLIEKDFARDYLMDVAGWVKGAAK